MNWWKRNSPPQPTAGEETPTDDPPLRAAPEKNSLLSLCKKFLRPRHLGIGMLLAAAVALVVTSSQWLPNLSERPEYQVKADLIKITPPPNWVPSDFLDKVLRAGQLPETLSLLDRELIPKVVAAFQNNAWVQDVIQVRKAYPSELIVELRYRSPVAMVRVSSGPGAGLYPVDPEGIVLPPEDFSPEIAAAYPQILNVAPPPSVVLGEPWKDRAVCEAAQLLTQLGSRIREYRLTGIEIPADSDAGGYVLRTRGDTAIVWGRGPLHDHPGDLTTRQKIGRLEEVAKRNGGDLDAGGDALIDITPWDRIRTEKRSVAEKPESKRQF